MSGQQRLTADTRVTSVDALRGFALLGILLVNIGVFASTFYGLDIADPNFDRPIDRATNAFVALLFETKFYLLFSFLFGYSFTLQMRSAERTQASFAPRLLRRLAGLWLIGLAHAVLLYHGDILTTYAVLGVALLALRNKSDRTLLRLAAWLIGVTALVWACLGLLEALFPTPVNRMEVMTQAQTALRAYAGTPATVIAQHLQAMSTVWVVLALIQAPFALAMFLLGLVAGRREILARAEEYVPLLHRLITLGLCIGLPGAMLYAYCSAMLSGSPWSLAGLAIGLLTSPFLTAAYGAGALLFFQTESGARIRDALAPAGRMALSNYILQSLICSLIFYAYGLRLIGRMPPLAVLALGVAIFIVQLSVSRWWMARFAYGPLEWLLRALTLGAWPAWRKSAP